MAPELTGVWPLELGRRPLPDGRVLIVLPLFFGKARLGITTADFEDGGFNDVWDFPSVDAAVAAMTAWDGEGEPAGWDRHPESHRRRPEGDPAREFVRP